MVRLVSLKSGEQISLVYHDGYLHAPGGGKCYFTTIEGNTWAWVSGLVYSPAKSAPSLSPGVSRLSSGLSCQS